MYPSFKNNHNTASWVKSFLKIKCTGKYWPSVLCIRIWFREADLYQDKCEKYPCTLVQWCRTSLADGLQRIGWAINRLLALFFILITGLNFHVVHIVHALERYDIDAMQIQIIQEDMALPSEIPRQACQYSWEQKFRESYRSLGTRVDRYSR